MRLALTCFALLGIIAPNAAYSINRMSDFFELTTRDANVTELDVDVEAKLMQYGSFMLANMNRSLDPCENFYDYACGNWKKSAWVPLESRNDTFLHTIQLQINQLLVKFLENSTQIDAQSHSAELKAKQFYGSCVRMRRDMQHGYRQLMATTDDRFKDVSTRTNNSSDDWIYVNFMSEYEMYPLLPMKINYNTQLRKFDVQFLPPKKVLGEAKTVDFKNLTRDFKLDDDEQRQALETEYKMLVEFEANLTAHATTRNVTEIRTLGEFLEAHKRDRLNWTRYFELAFNGTQRNEWIIYNTIDEVTPLVRFLQRTEVQTLRAYVKWRVLIKFYYIWKFEVADKSVQHSCREHTEQYYNYALLPWFIEQVFDAERRADILELAKRIKTTFYGFIERHTWLDEETRSQAKTKLHAMDVLVGYNDEMRHRRTMNQVYSDVNMTNDWYENLRALERNRARVRLRSVNRALIPTLMSMRSVNAYYADFLNLAQITIGLAQWPFYDMHLPASLKYGGIGSIIGHEMAHGFDTHCYRINYAGKPQNWWTEASLRNFRERYRCLETQYDKYVLLGTLSNLTLTLAENIADNVGARLAYHAYMADGGKQDGDKRPISSVEYTNKQLYFLKFAQTWCTGKNDASKLQKLKTDPHAYEEFRVIGTLSNMPEFSEAFKCKLGANMNPIKKCVIW